MSQHCGTCGGTRKQCKCQTGFGASSFWEDAGASLGRAMASALSPLADAVRAHCAAKFGTCRYCGAPLDGPHPARVCDSPSCEGLYCGETLADRMAEGIAEGDADA